MSLDDPNPDVAGPAPRAAMSREIAAVDAAAISWRVLLVGTSLAGLLAWALGEWVEKSNQVAIVSEFTVAGGSQLAQRAAAITRRAVLSHSLLGGLLAAALGLVGGWRRGPRWASIAAISGGVLGALAGGGASMLAVPLFLRNENTQAEDLLPSLLTHAGMFIPIGASAGLALGLGRKGSLRRALGSMLGGMAGGLAAALAHEFLGALFFPMDQTGQPISQGAGSRLFTRLIVALGIAVLATRGGRGRAADPTPQSLP